MTIAEMLTVRTLIALGLDDATITAAINNMQAGTTVQPVTARATVAAAPQTADESPRDGAVTYRAVVNVDRLARMKLTPQQRRVAEYVIANPGKTSKQIAAATGIGEKAVQSPIYQLRDTSPRVLKSSRE
jgi:DNA-binding NarL/FixJ family response regulator